MVNDLLSFSQEGEFELPKQFVSYGDKLCNTVSFPQQKKRIERRKKKNPHFFHGNLQVSLVAALSSFLGRHMFTLVGSVFSVWVSGGIGWVLPVFDLYHFKNSRQVNSMLWNQSHLHQQLSKFLLGIIEHDWLYENESRKPHSKRSWEAMKGELSYTTTSGSFQRSAGVRTISRLGQQWGAFTCGQWEAATTLNSHFPPKKFCSKQLLPISFFSL